MPGKGYWGTVGGLMGAGGAAKQQTQTGKERSDAQGKAGAYKRF